MKNQDANSRRTFLRNLGAGASALSLPLLGYGNNQFAQNESSGLYSLLKNADNESLGQPGRKLGIALVGLGYYSANLLAPALQETKNCRLAGIVTGTPSKATEWMQKYNIPKANVYDYKNFDRIADNKDIDVVYVVLPNSMHAEYVIRAAQAGKHVICEKPMAIYPKECQAMIDACKKANKQLAIGYRLHYEPFTKEIMRLGQEKVFGAVKFIESSDGFRSGDPTQWRLKKSMAGGGPLMDVGIYAVQGTRYVTGEEPISVTAQFAPKTDPVKFKDVEETMFWQFEFPGGAVSNSTTSYASGVERLYASCEKGWFELSPAFGYGPLKGRTSKGPIEMPVVNHQAAHMDGVCKDLLDGKQLPDHVTGAEGLRDTKLLQAIYQAAETGRKINLKA
ncbi:Gfo/Idh/MocA family protein [Spirosoma pollinicola]|uniref:Glucose-fructose oxidoreductase n=1 Tax=Spirosoma pollinicola TaxID=2057025 RepID=A0A2K8YXL0_9BACT|nr:Gfo/Idh/MocA family oxidoreductase [Spirosoma pollinicola]AUD02365.1 glucose-fructose oxidoreductase [Spirosoma pollinicola]